MKILVFKYSVICEHRLDHIKNSIIFVTVSPTLPRAQWIGLPRPDHILFDFFPLLHLRGGQRLWWFEIKTLHETIKQFLECHKRFICHEEMFDVSRVYFETYQNTIKNIEVSINDEVVPGCS